jgi:hypothetical protein
MKKLVSLGLCLFATLFVAQRGATQTTPAFLPKKAIEIDALWPFYPGTLRGHFVFQAWQKDGLRGDVLIGANYDLPHDRPTEGRFSDLSLVTGYRQYFWRGLHLEFNQTTGLGTLESHVSTGKDYQSFDWLVSGYVGYRFDFFQKRWYVLPQFGVAGVLYKSNPWPIFEDKTLSKEIGETPFPLGLLRVGIRF